MLVMMCNGAYIKELRQEARLTLTELADLLGYSPALISEMEEKGEGSAAMKESLLSLLLQVKEEGIEIKVKLWRDRALKAEEQVALLKSVMKGMLKS